MIVVMTASDGTATEIPVVSVKIQQGAFESAQTATVRAPYSSTGTYSSCSITSGDRELFRGYVAGYRVLLEDGSSFIDYTCRTCGGKLEINSVIPMQLESPTLYDLLDLYAAPLGNFSSILAKKTYSGTFEISSSVNVWTMIEQFVQDVYFAQPIINADGSITLGLTLGGTDRVINTDDASLLEVETVCNLDGLITEVWGKSDVATSYFCLFTNKTATELGVNRKKVLTYSFLNAQELVYRARSIVRQSNLKNYYYRLRVVGISDVSLWDSIVSDHPQLADKDLAVGRKVMTYDTKDGVVTDLYLYPPRFIEFFE